MATIIMRQRLNQECVEGERRRVGHDIIREISRDRTESLGQG